LPSGKLVITLHSNIVINDVLYISNLKYFVKKVTEIWFFNDFSSELILITEVLYYLFDKLTPNQIFQMESTVFITRVH